MLRDVTFRPHKSKRPHHTVIKVGVTSTIHSRRMHAIERPNELSHAVPMAAEYLESLIWEPVMTTNPESLRHDRKVHME